MRFFRLLVRILLLCIGLVFLISCGRDISRQSLADIESYIDSRPDSALAAIRQIDTQFLYATVPITMGSGHYLILFTLPSGLRYKGELDI